MTGPNFTKQISLGNALQIVAMLVAVGAGWATLNGRVDNVDERARQNAAQIDAMRPQLVQVQRNEARTDARLQNIEGGVSRIESNVSDLTRYLRELQR